MFAGLWMGEKPHQKSKLAAPSRIPTAANGSNHSANKWQSKRTFIAHC
jgi:hypothetical protein